MSAWSLLALLSAVLAAPLPALEQVPGAEAAAEAESRCLGGGDVRACREVALRRLSFELARGSVEWTLLGGGRVLAELPCPEGAVGQSGRLAACLEESYPAGALLSDGDVAIYVIPGEQGELRQLLLSAGPPVTTPSAWQDRFDGGGPVHVLSDREVEAPALSAALAPLLARGAFAMVGRWSQEGIVRSERPPANSLLVNRPLTEVPLIVCAQEIVRPAGLALVSVGLGLSGLSTGEQVVSPIYNYRLPCDAELLLPAETPGIQPGPRPASPPAPAAAVDPTSGQRTYTLGALVMTASGTIAPGAPGGLSCAVRLAGREVLRARACRLPFAADLNGDGQLDFVLDRYAEMGCGGSSLWLSAAEGAFTPHSLSEWGC
jgi:hypothetical protein